MHKTCCVVCYKDWSVQCKKCIHFWFASLDYLGEEKTQRDIIKVCKYLTAGGEVKITKTKQNGTTDCAQW